MIFVCCIQLNTYKNCILIIKKREKCLFSMVLENTCVDFFFIYIKFVNFLKDLINILITLKKFIHEINGQHYDINIGPTNRLIFKY